jgi:hypothetical protein
MTFGNKKGCLLGAALGFLQVYRLSLSPYEDPGCPKLKLVLNPKDENQYNTKQNSDREISVHRVLITFTYYLGDSVQNLEGFVYRQNSRNIWSKFVYFDEYKGGG